MEGTKLPGLRNCCFYLPLREGLLAFTYISLIYHILYLAAAFLLTGTIVIFSGMGEGLRASDLLWFVPLPLLFGLVFYNVHVIAATHMNNAKGIKNSIIFGAGLWVITILFCVYLSYNIIEYAESPFCWQLAIVILEPFLQGYGLLLIHSLKLKLRAEGKFDYINLE